MLVSKTDVKDLLMESDTMLDIRNRSIRGNIQYKLGL